PPTASADRDRGRILRSREPVRGSRLRREPAPLRLMSPGRGAVNRGSAMRALLSVSGRKDRLVPWALLALGCALLAPLVLSPKAGVAVVAGGLLLWSASRSVAWPLGLAGFAAPVVALAGHDPFPNRSAPLILFAWICAAVAFALGRGRPSGPLRAALASPLFVATGALVAMLLVRLPASTDPAYGNFKVELFLLGVLPLLVAGVLLGSRPQDVELFLVLA